MVAAPLWTVVSEFVQRGWKTVATFDAQISSVLALPQPVTSQQCGGPERPPALRAVVRLQPTVDPLVLDEDGLMLETFVTLRTFM